VNWSPWLEQEGRLDLGLAVDLGPLLELEADLLLLVEDLDRLAVDALDLAGRRWPAGTEACRPP
jgi:hypothetical protein